MTTAEFTLRLICLQPNEKDRLDWLEAFFKLYDVKEKPMLLAAFDPEAKFDQQLQTSQQQMGGKLPDGYMLS